MEQSMSLYQYHFFTNSKPPKYVVNTSSTSQVYITHSLSVYRILIKLRSQIMNANVDAKYIAEHTEIFNIGFIQIHAGNMLATTLRRMKITFYFQFTQKY